ncbi:MAG: phosphate regulon transcriptional regulatory protein PhoB [Rubrivivax sp. SCN 71-131]|nr:MAG: phosphate regulon transcriptional regulatory protein PhoB [Rubrivivax sp. SCN 71-131]
MGRILVVDDEAAIVELIALNLRHEGHEVRMAYDSESASNAVRESLPDLVLLDWMLPGEPGVSLARRWRGDPRTKALPIVMLTARADERDVVQGLDAGADDYLAKPFSTNELMARVRAVLRRKAPEALDAPVEAGPLRLDPSTRRVHWGPGEVSLGPTEFRLLRYLMTYPERVHSRAQLLDRVWGDHVFIEERTVDVHIKRLRDALHPVGCSNLIETVRGAGYRLARPSPAAA